MIRLDIFIRKFLYSPPGVFSILRAIVYLSRVSFLLIYSLYAGLSVLRAYHSLGGRGPEGIEEGGLPETRNVIAIEFNHRRSAHLSSELNWRLR